jgi:hypothetical protein
VAFASKLLFQAQRPCLNGDSSLSSIYIILTGLHILSVGWLSQCSIFLIF